MNVIEKYESKYGLAAKMVLRNLGGDPDAIINNYIRNVSNVSEEEKQLFSSMMFTPITSDADNIQNEILKEIERLYFSGISRESAVAICNTLISGGEISITSVIDGLKYDAYQFMVKWNAVNKEKGKIYPPIAFDI